MKCDCLRPADRFSSAFRFSVFSFRPRIFWFSAREVLRNHSTASAGHWTSAVNLGRRNSGLAPEFLVVWVVVRFFQLHTGRQPRILAELTAKLTIYRSFRFNLQFTQFAYTTLAFSRHCSSRHAQALSQSPCEHPEDPRAASRNPPPPTDLCFAIPERVITVVVSLIHLAPSLLLRERVLKYSRPGNPAGRQIR